MRICFVSRGTLNTFWDDYGGSDADILFFGFQGLGEVSYEKELRGETGYFEDAAILSKENHNVVVCGCVTDTRGVKRKSAVVAENGRLLGVSDMLNAIDGDFKSGAGLRVYETKVGRALSVCGSDLILCPCGIISDSTESVLLRAGAFSSGVTMCLCGAGYSQIADVSGATMFASPDSPVEFSFDKKQEYHLIETRRRGFYKTPRRDF